MDKILVLDEGDWIAYHTITETRHDSYGDHSTYFHAMLHIKFEKGGAGKNNKGCARP
jgi:hypothetical protein